MTQPKELEWKKELYTLLNEYADKKNFYWTHLGEDLTKLITKTLTQQRTELLDKGKKYEFTRKEIIGWLHDQNWKCQELESILLQKRNLK